MRLMQYVPADSQEARGSEGIMSVVECDVPRHSALGKGLRNFRATARLDEPDADCAQQGRSFSRPGGADYVGNTEHGKERSLLCRRKDRTMANLFSRLGRTRGRPRQQAYGF